MPIIRSSEQKSKTLEEFYKEFISDTSSSFYNEVGKVMCSFLSMVNDTFIRTTLYGLTSHDTLTIQPTDKWEDGWYIAITALSDKIIQFEYKMNEKSPWRYAIVKGQANTIQEAREFLIIAMTETGGWKENKELRKLYNKMKAKKTENPKFTLWLEFEEVDTNNWDIDNEFCNIHVDLEDGRHYGLNVWTYKFLETSINYDKETGQNLGGLYQKPPDLFVKELTRECIEQTIQDLLKTGDLEKVLNPSIYDGK